MTKIKLLKINKSLRTAFFTETITIYSSNSHPQPKPDHFLL